MRRRIALPKHFVQKASGYVLPRFASAFGVRARPRVALSMVKVHG
jgi:hypothetical protein